MNKPMLSVVMLLCVCLVGCATQPAAIPVINKSPERQIPTTIKVLPADSLYSIAWRFGLNPQKIAQWNGLSKPYSIRAGQVLRLRRTSTSQTPATTPPVTSERVANAIPVAAKQQSPQPPKQRTTAPRQWNWPAQGKLLRKFSPRNGHNGIQIGGTPGSAIRATAAGQVVYAGEGLRGYGKLIIVKHSATYLSAYAHNRKIMVMEGEHIRAGQQIAQMGHSEADRTMLHFEIRENGTPADPLKFLPNQ